MIWNLPNKLTVGRIGIAAAFFVLLGFYEQGTAWGCWLLNAAFVLYLLAALTDVLDGWLARRMNMVSAFGRMVDPFVDKVLVVGAFVMLTGSNFYNAAPPSAFERAIPAWIRGNMASIVQAWMVVLILAREFIVSAIRGYSESQGVKFPATPAGKIRMFLQSVAICAVLFQLANHPYTVWAIALKVVSVWLAVGVTLASGVVYVDRARRLLRGTKPA